MTLSFEIGGHTQKCFLALGAQVGAGQSGLKCGWVNK